MVKKHHLRERINSKKYCKTPSLIYCLMIMMMRAVMMKMLVVAIVMVWTGGPSILAVMMIAINLMMVIF